MIAPILTSPFIKRTRRARIHDNEPLQYASVEDNPKWSYDYGAWSVATSICTKYYSYFDDIDTAIWPDDFRCNIPFNEKKVRGQCLHIAYKLMWALSCQWVGVLSSLELRMMLAVVGRTWTWCKPREGIALRMFREGVFDNECSECLQAGIGGNDAGLLRARNNLDKAGLLSYGMARTSVMKMQICWYEVNVETVLCGADQLRNDEVFRTDWRNMLRGVKTQDKEGTQPDQREGTQPTKRKQHNGRNGSGVAAETSV